MVLLPKVGNGGGELTLKAKQWKKRGNKSHQNLPWTTFLLGLGFSESSFVFCLGGSVQLKAGGTLGETPSCIHLRCLGTVTEGPVFKNHEHPDGKRHQREPLLNCSEGSVLASSWMDQLHR